MTTEVVVLNREAVAVAADSAVTTSNLDPSGRIPKIHHTANKIFQLSSSEPIAIMVYGSAAFGLIPWETVVKEYRRQLDDTVYETVDEYAQHFIDSLASLVPHYPPKVQEATVQRKVDYEKKLLLAWQSAAKEWTDTEWRSNLLEVLDGRIDYLGSRPCLDQISDSDADKQIGAAFDDIKPFLEVVSGRLDIDRGILDKAQALLRLSLKSLDENGFSSGLVIVGFGSAQLFPALSHYAVDGVVVGKARARKLCSEEIDEKRFSAVRPFGQDDMIRVFLDGIDPSYTEALGQVVSRTLDRSTEPLAQAAAKLLVGPEADRFRQQLQRVQSTVLDDFDDNLEQFLKDRHRAEIMAVVELLPKEELADMAEALVSLTSLKRRMTPGAETVGGPVDVAVLSKGDGFVWIKRKHYFPMELNVRYFERVHGLGPRRRERQDL